MANALAADLRVTGERGIQGGPTGTYPCRVSSPQSIPSALKCTGEGFSCLQTSQESRTQAMRTWVDWLPHRLQYQPSGPRTSLTGMPIQ